MEGSGIAGEGRVNRRDTNEIIFAGAGLPAKAAAAWLKARPRVTGDFKRDAAAGDEILASRRRSSRQVAEKAEAHAASSSWRPTSFCRNAVARAKQFLDAPRRGDLSQADQESFANFVRVDELAYDAAKLVPGTDADTQAGRRRKRADAKREGRRRSRSGHFPRARARACRNRHASLPRDAAAEAGGDRARARNSSRTA